MLTVSTVLQAAELEFKARRELWDLKIHRVNKGERGGGGKDNRREKGEQIELFSILSHMKHRV